MFALYDTNQDGEVNTSKLEPLVIEAGMQPSEEQLVVMKENVDPEKKGTFKEVVLIQNVVYWEKMMKFDDLVNKAVVTNQLTSAVQTSNTDKTIVIPTTSITGIVEKFTPPVSKKKFTAEELKYTPPLKLSIVDVSEVGMLSLAFNRQVGLNASFFEKYKKSAEFKKKAAGFQQTRASVKSEEASATTKKNGRMLEEELVPLTKEEQ